MPEDAAAAPTPTSGDWFKPDLRRDELVRLSRRNDRAGAVHFGAFFLLLGALGAVAVLTWGTWWFLVPYGAYCFVWSFANATGHEACHYTPFRSLRLNNALLYVNAWMLSWEPVTVRWVHARHHSFTSMVGDDAEYLLANPIRRRDLANLTLGTNHFWNYNKELVLLAFGRPTPMITKSVPPEELPRTARNARIFIVLYAAVIGWSIAVRSPLPALMLLAPRVVGEPMHGILRILQHGGLETGVADHRRTTRTMYVSRPMQWLYCNMNYHIEHHMYPMVPFHALPDLHRAIKDQLPAPTRGIRAGMIEVVRTMRRQRVTSDYTLPDRIPGEMPIPGEPPIPDGAASRSAANGSPDGAPPVEQDGAIDLCGLDDVPPGDVLGIECPAGRYAVYRTDDGRVYASVDRCTHEDTPLSEGMLVGCEIECPLHLGRFDVTTGEATRPPARENLETCPVEVVAGRVLLRPPPPGRVGG